MELKDRNNKSTPTRKFNLDEEHRKLVGKLDIDNFNLSRIPRPEDETPESIKENIKKKREAKPKL